MKKMKIADVLIEYNKKIKELYCEERAILEPLFKKEFLEEYVLDFGYDYQRLDSIMFRKKDGSIRMNFYIGIDGNLSCRRSPWGTRGDWTQKEVNDIKRRIESLDFSRE